jgi:hypothetical protein
MCPVHARIPPAELSGRERTTIPRRPAEGARPSSAGLLRLQRSAGNRAVLDLLSRDTAPVIARSEVPVVQRYRPMSVETRRRVQSDVQRLRREVRRLELERDITSEERRIIAAELGDTLREARDLARDRPSGSPAERRELRETADALVRHVRALRRGYIGRLRSRAEQQRRGAASRPAGRPLHGIPPTVPVTGVRDFRITPGVIRVDRNEAARISFVVTEQPTSISAMILSHEHEEGTSHREFVWRAPNAGYQAAIWDGTFTGSRNRPPRTGTYRVRVHVRFPDNRTEQFADQIRVENPTGDTVLPRLESGLALRSLTFDGRHAVLTDEGGNQIVMRAVSGLMPHHRRNPSHVDYTRPERQWEPDRGPLPSGLFTIRRDTVQQPEADGDTLRYPSGQSATAWGPMRVPLQPGRIANRHGFFVHLDVTNDGTAGCIGIHPGDEGKFNQMMSLLARMPADTLPVIVNY